MKAKMLKNKNLKKLWGLRRIGFKPIEEECEALVGGFNLENPIEGEMMDSYDKNGDDNCYEREGYFQHPLQSMVQSIKFAKDLQSALETVYVGQMCLSWEMLQLQYRKAKEIVESKLDGTRRYNIVAEDFLQFQCLIQNFLRSKCSQGRVHHYILNRFVLKNFLEVPIITEDPIHTIGVSSSKEAITSSMLFGIVEESVRIFWEFIRSEKNHGTATLKNHVKLQDPADSKLLSQVQKILHKKESREVRRFQKRQEERPNQLVFLLRVDMQLVSRVLSLSRLTFEHLIWCHRKLTNVEPSFLPFPC